MGQRATNKTSVPPLDFAQFLTSHQRAIKSAGVKPRAKNKFGNRRPASIIKKEQEEVKAVLAKVEREEAAKILRGIIGKYVRNRYSDRSTPEGKALHAIITAIEKDVGKPFDARQSLLMSVIRSKIVVIMCIGKYLEATDEIIDYQQGSVPHVVDKTFLSYSTSLRSALNELYSGKNAKARGKKTYEDIVAGMKVDK
jgi:hypothetical protein